MKPRLPAGRKHCPRLKWKMAGLLASRVLTDHFERVSVIEHAVLPELAEQRRGVPQGPQTDGLLASGREMLKKKLFPSIFQALMSESCNR